MLPAYTIENIIYRGYKIMGKHSRAGLSEYDRRVFLRNHGFIMEREGNGHEMWRNPEYIQMIQEKPHIQVPENIIPGGFQGARRIDVISVPHNPGPGTWHRIKRTVEWCHNKVQEERQKELQANKKRVCARAGSSAQQPSSRPQQPRKRKKSKSHKIY